jgi:NodT family efflux transporter outer membrane factor (OMF) lipoprotein
MMSGAAIRPILPCGSGLRDGATKPRGVGAIAIAGCLLLAGCGLIGPDYRPPDAELSAAWMDAGDGGPIRAEPAVEASWWNVFGDPVLDALIETAYAHNPSLQAAGARVLEAVARRGVAFGSLFPQQQELFGGYNRVHPSDETVSGEQPDFGEWQLGFDAAWELDVWGRLRRGVEAADAGVLASVASYDDVLVSLIAEVARNYILLRTFQERLVVARANVAVQQGSYDIAEARFRSGAVSELDAAQASSLLADTSALIPELETRIRQVQNTLCVLLGTPPHDLADMLEGDRPIPSAPRDVAVGVPAELLRRRPDVRRAERTLAAQSARIGIAKADLLPQFSLTGTIEVTAEHADDLFTHNAFEAFGGPGFRWAILNYGRLTNNVRVEDARYQALVGDYESTVLAAQAEVESAIAEFLGAQKQVDFLSRSVEAARRAVQVADTQYREGAVDYTRVLNTQQFLVQGQDRLVDTKGTVALSLTALYKALGGGWQMREGHGFVSHETGEQMRARTWWGKLVEEDRVRKVSGPAANGGAEPSAPAPQP